MEENMNKPTFLGEVAKNTVTESELENKLRKIVERNLDKWAEENYAGLKADIMLQARAGGG